MAILTIPQIDVNIPNPMSSQQALDFFCISAGYPEFVDDGNGNLIPNPQTKAQFAKQVVGNYIAAMIKGAAIDARTVAERNQAASDYEAIQPL